MKTNYEKSYLKQLKRFGRRKKQSFYQDHPIEKNNVDLPENKDMLCYPVTHSFFSLHIFFLRL
jgi:hypothetical protein